MKVLDAWKRAIAPERREPTSGSAWPAYASYTPELLPPPELMAKEHITILEDWYAWANEWNVLLRVFGGLKNSSAVLEIGCGLGRIAYGLRDNLSLGGGSYRGFDICKYKIDFLQSSFGNRYPNFHFAWADVRNTTYNPGGKIQGAEFRFPYDDASFDVVYAASVFTHMLPATTEHYFQEAARVLRPGGRCLFSFFLLDYYRPGQKRPFSFNQAYFNLDHAYGEYGGDFATAQLENPEDMTGYSVALIRRAASAAGMNLVGDPLPGLWSGSVDRWYGTQDLIVLSS